MHSSNQKADGGQDTRCHSNGGERIQALIERHDCLRIQIAILLHLTEDHIGRKPLHRVVKLVLPKVAGLLAHPVVWPVRVALAMQRPEVLNHPQALLQNVRVQQRVQRVSAHGQGVDLSWHDPAVLLRCQVLCAHNKQRLVFILWRWISE